MQPDFEVLKRNRILDQPYFSSKLSIVGKVKKKIVLKYFQMNFLPQIKKTVFESEANANKNTVVRIIRELTWGKENWADGEGVTGES